MLTQRLIQFIVLRNDETFVTSEVGQACSVAPELKTQRLSIDTPEDGFQHHRRLSLPLHWPDWKCSGSLMTKVTLNDVLNAAYQRVEDPPPATRANTALLLVDIQHLASPEHLGDRAIAAGLPADEVEAALVDYAGRFHDAVGQCAELLASARRGGIPRIHVKIEAMSGDARDTGPAHRRMGWCYPPGSPESQFLEAVAPQPGEIVVTKTVSGAFTSTNLDALLRHMGIVWLIVAGFETDECIEATGRVALDLGYMALFARDACTAYDSRAHDNVMGKYASWGLVRSTAQLKSMVESLE